MHLAALYGAQNHGGEWQRCYSSLLRCLSERFGAPRVWQRNVAYYDPADVANDALISVILGLRGEGKRYAERSIELGVPTVVVDLGFLRRERGFWQVNLNQLNNPPPEAPSGDRFDALNLKVFNRIQATDRGHILIGGQVPGDAQHDLATERDMLDWARAAAEHARELFPKKRIFWRPHPSFVKPLNVAGAIMTSTNRGINEFVKEEHIHHAVVYNSTLGLDLLRIGVNVVAQGPRTVYTDLVSSKIEDLMDSHPGPERIKSLLQRLAYGQYQLNELENWDTFESLLKLHGVTGDW